MRLPKSTVELLDALVVHEKKQIASNGLAGTSSRTAVLEALIVSKARQAGLLPVEDVEPTIKGALSTPDAPKTEPRSGTTKAPPQKLQSIYERVAGDPLGEDEPEKSKKTSKTSTKRVSKKSKTAWTRVRKPEV